jgi:hypothetical protein
VVDITARVPELRDRHCASIGAAAPLTASFRVVGSDLFWELGPYRAGQYRFVLDDGRVALPQPERAGFRMRGRPEALRLRVAYASPEGWVTYSPELSLQLVGSPVVSPLSHAV